MTVKEQLLKSARALHAGAREIEKYVKLLDTDGIDWENVDNPIAIANAAMWLSDKRADEIMAGGD